MTTPRLPSAEEFVVGLPEDPCFDDYKKALDKYARAVLETAAEVQELYGLSERSDEIAERIRALKADL